MIQGPAFFSGLLRFARKDAAANAKENSITRKTLRKPLYFKGFGKFWQKID